MGGIRYELRGEDADGALIERLAAQHPRVGLAGLLRARGTRARPGRVPAEAAVEGFRWGVLDSWSVRWWPQGIEVLGDGVAGDSVAGDSVPGDGVAGDRVAGDRLLFVSWFAQRGRGVHRGSRITVVDRRDPRRPRYHHVLLVEAVPAPERSGSAPARVQVGTVGIHAGGVALVGTRLYVAATFGGLRVFDLDDILRVTGRPLFGFRHVLPQRAHQRLHGGEGEERMRFSFVSVEHAPKADGTDAGDRLVVGEFGPHPTGRRLGRLSVAGMHDSPDAAEVTELREPGIPRMQGAALIDGTWFVSASNGLHPGDLWVGRDDAWTRHRHVLPPGPEDLAATADGRRLWSLCEYPRRRWVYAVDAARWAAEPARGDRAG